MKKVEKCQICGNICKNLRGVITHVRFVHHITKRIYYDKYLRKNGEGICKMCQKPTNFISVSRGYRVYCSLNCRASDPDFWKVVGDTKKCKYGNSHYVNQEKSKEPCLRRYGVTNINKTESGRIRCRKTMIENRFLLMQGVLAAYGVDNVFKLPEKQMQRNQTMLQKYGYEYNFENTNIRIKGQLKKYDNGYWLPINQRSQYRNYWLMVMCETRRWIKEMFSKWDGTCYYTGMVLSKNIDDLYKANYATIDHKISIKYGFEHDIPSKEIGCINNLCICGRFVNNVKSSLTESEFVEKKLNAIFL